MTEVFILCSMDNKIFGMCRMLTDVDHLHVIMIWSKCPVCSVWCGVCGDA